MAPGLFEQDHELLPAEAAAAVGLGDGEPEPAQLADLPPELGRIALGRCGELAHLRQAAASVQQLAYFVAEELLLLGECKVHVASSGPGATRSGSTMGRIQSGATGVRSVWERVGRVSANSLRAGLEHVLAALATAGQAGTCSSLT